MERKLAISAGRNTLTMPPVAPRAAGIALTSCSTVRKDWYATEGATPVFTRTKMTLGPGIEEL